MKTALEWINEHPYEVAEHGGRLIAVHPEKGILGSADTQVAMEYLLGDLDRQHKIDVHKDEIVIHRAPHLHLDQRIIEIIQNARLCGLNYKDDYCESPNFCEYHKNAVRAARELQAELNQLREKTNG